MLLYLYFAVLNTVLQTCFISLSQDCGV